MPTCQDGTPTGLRDEIIIRLGLAGMRVTEIATLRVEHVAHLPHVHWIGKANRPRTLVTGDNLCTAIQRWLLMRSHHATAPGEQRRSHLGATPSANTDPKRHLLESEYLTLSLGEQILSDVAGQETGGAVCAAIKRWHTMRPDDATSPRPQHALLLPEIPATAQRGRTRQIDWHATTPLDKSTLYRIVTRRAQQAGLGHVAPHDLRRSAASILHHSTTDDGAHRFDLLDIQRVLGHTDPATTMRSYLEPMDTTVIKRASRFLD